MDGIYSEARHEFERRLKVLNPKQIDLELKIYDTMVRSIKNRHKRLEDEVDETYGQEYGEFDRIFDSLIDIRMQYQVQFPEKSLDELADIVKESPEYESMKQEFMDTRLSRAEHYSRLYGHLPAFLSIFNYNPDKHDDGIVKANTSHGIVGKLFYARDAREEVDKLAYDDGAFILSPKANVIAVEAEIDYHPSIHLGKPKDKNKINLELGFKARVSLRHAAAWFASKNMPGTIVYVLGEEAQMIRRFEHGINTASTHMREAKNFKKITDELDRIRAGY